MIPVQVGNFPECHILQPGVRQHSAHRLYFDKQAQNPKTVVSPAILLRGYVAFKNKAHYRIDRYKCDSALREPTRQKCIALWDLRAARPGVTMDSLSGAEQTVAHTWDNGARARRGPSARI